MVDTPSAGVALIVAALLIATEAHAQYLQRRSVTTTGGVTFTGNTLGLSKATGANAPGTEDSIGTFITTDSTSRDPPSPVCSNDSSRSCAVNADCVAPGKCGIGTCSNNSTRPCAVNADCVAPGSCVPLPGWPLGTTADWRGNSSAATLQLPAGSTVVYAELVWGGSYSYGGEDVSAFLNTPVSLTTPAGTAAVSRDPATARQLGTPATNGRCNSGAPCFYVRSADVTALVQAGGPGTYVVGGVPATQGTSEDSLNSAGWTLAIIYENFSLPVRNLSIFTGAEQSGAAAAQASGFCTPPTGRLAGRLAVSAIEGDASNTGDSMRFGATAALPDAARLVGSNNKIDNFFSSQINDASGALDTSGTFGTVNHVPNDNTAGGRQGWDITNVDVSPRLQNAQTVAFARGTTSGDVYVITTLGLQIDVGAPDLSGATVAVDKAATVVGDTLTYTIVLPNSGTIAAANGVLTAPPPPGTALVPNSVTVGGAAQPGADPAAGVPLGSIAGGQSRTVTFRVTVNAVPPAPAPAAYTLEPRFSYQFVSCAGQPVQSATFAPGTATTGIARIEATKAASPATATPGSPVSYTVTVTNSGAAPGAGVTVTDPIPAGTTYVPGSTTLNGTAVPDVAGTMPFASGGLVSSPGDPAGQVAAGASATVRFDVLVNPDASGNVTNTALVDPDGGGPLPTFTAAVTSAVTPSADLTVTKTGPTSTTSNANVTYTIVVTNAGPSLAAGVVLDDPTPAGLSFVSATGGCSGFPCTLGALAADESRTIQVTFNVPNGYSAPDPIVNTASVSSLTQDPAMDNNSAAAATSLGAPVAVLTVAKSNGTTTVVPGTPTTYTITVTNTGPNDSPGVRIIDPVPAGLTSVDWTCSVTGAGSCTPAAGSSAVFTTVNLPAGATATIQLTGTVSPDATDTLVNTVAAQNTPGVGGTSMLTATDTDQLEPQADLSVTKELFEFQLNPDTRQINAVYNIVVQNAGPSAAVGVTLADVPDAQLSFVSNSGDCTTPFPCDLGTIPPGGSRRIQSRFEVPADLTGTPVVNDARVTAITADLNPGNNTSSVTAFPPSAADIAVEVRFQPDAALVGGEVTVFVRVANLGPSSATDVVLTAQLPAGLEFVDASPDVGTYDPVTGEWQVGDMAADPAVSRVLRITARVTQPGRIAMLAVKTGANEFDPVVGNDSAGDVLNEEAELADVVVEKIATPASGNVNDVLLTGIVLTNAGPGPATGIVVTDLPTAGLLPLPVIPLPGIVDPNPSQGTYDEGTKIWMVGDLAPGATAALGILAVVTAPGPQGNTAGKVSANEPDPNPLNDRDGAPVNSESASEITVTKAVSSGRVRVGDQVTFTVKATNSSLRAPVSGIVLTDVLPPGLTFLAATPSAGTFDPGTLVWTVGDIPANGSEILTLRGRVDQPGEFVNTATLTGGDLPEITPMNDSATATVIAGIGADLSIKKTADLENAVPGLPVRYTVTVRNDGPSPVTAAPVTDTLPAVLQNATWTCVPDAGASCAQPSGTDDIDTTVDLVAGSSVVFTITGTVAPDALGILENAATIVPPPGAEDPDPTDNESTLATNLVPESSLSITKTGPATALPGGTIEYTIVVSNAGPSTAAAVVVNDPTPAGLAFVSTAGDCVTAFPCVLGSVPPGASRSITATYTVLADVASVANVATLASATLNRRESEAGAGATTVILLPTETTTTTSSTVATTIPPPTTTTTSTAPTTSTSTTLPAADLSLTKTASPTQVGVGETLTYTLVVTNAGPAPATAVTLTDPLPALVRFASANATQGSCGAAGGTVTCALGDLAPGATATATIVVTRTGTALISNTASVSAAETDPSPQDARAGATTAAAGTEDCGNCQDDDGDGLVDAEDPDCCTPQPLTVTSARFRAPKSRLRVSGTIAGSPFAGVDPRRQDVRLQMRNADGSLVCCTLAPQRWQRLFGRTYGFFDQTMQVCPNVQCVKLALPANGTERTTVILGRMSPSTVASPLQFTLGVGEQCTQGTVVLRSTRKGSAVFP